MSRLKLCAIFVLTLLALPVCAQDTGPQLTGGKKVALPPPYATKSAGNGPSIADAPKGFLPSVPPGFQVNLFAKDFDEPRALSIAPNGDIFVADGSGGKVIILRDPQRTGGAQQRENFVTGINRPFGIAFHEGFVYVGGEREIVRFPYDPKTSKRLGPAEHLLDVPKGGHNTRDLAFSPGGKHLFIAVGSLSNVETDDPQIRAAITICDPDGKNARIFAAGLRNPVGIAFEPVSGKLWASVNERDLLGDDLPPDYFTSVQDGGFYGWPYSYIGDNVDVRAKPPRPDLVAKAIVPDVLLGAHVAPIQFAFYTAKQFPAKYRGGAFLAEHGSWNRSTRSGYQVVFVPFKNGQPSAIPEVFLSGFVPDPKQKDVWGRPAGVAVAPDGSLLVTDDGADVIWRISAK